MGEARKIKGACESCLFESILIESENSGDWIKEVESHLADKRCVFIAKGRCELADFIISNVVSGVVE